MRLIQLTDCHIVVDKEAEYKGNNTYQSLKKVLEHVKRHHRDYDGFLLTGDISQDGSVESYQHVKELLAFNKRPAFTLPGNHDDLLDMREVFRTAGIDCTHTSDLGNWQLIMLNSQVPGEPYGEISQTDLNWLNFWLNNSDKPTLVALHHHCVPCGSTWMDNIMLQNSEELMSVLLGHEHVKGIVFGHIHQELDHTSGHIRIFGTPSTCHQFLPNAEDFALDGRTAAYRVIELNDDGSIDSHIVRL